MIKILLLLLITIVFFGCSSPSKKNINKMLDIKVEEVIENIEAKDLPQLVITQRLNYFLFPLFLGLFTSIILIVSGVRIIGFSVLLASITCIVLIISLTVYLKLIALVGIGTLFVGIYFLGKNIYDKRITQRDLVNSVEIVKKLVPPKTKETLKKDLDIAQSRYTRKIVKEIKEK